MDMSEEDYAYITQPAPSDPMLELIQIIADISLLSKASSSICVSQGEACQNLLLGCIAQMERHTAWYTRWGVRIGGGPSLYGPGKYFIPLAGHFQPNLNKSLTGQNFQVN